MFAGLVRLRRNSQLCNWAQQPKSSGLARGLDLIISIAIFIATSISIYLKLYHFRYDNFYLTLSPWSASSLESSCSTVGLLALIVTGHSLDGCSCSAFGKLIRLCFRVHHQHQHMWLVNWTFMFECWSLALVSDAANNRSMINLLNFL